ncbi:MAG: transcriptional regulator, partial [Rhodospirillales bacterium]|nr:transcriptional regulator [Rhodospirillales bacterium]
LSEDPPEVFEHDPLTKRETLELVRAYYKIADPQVRKRIFELAKALGGTGRGDDSED